MVKTLTTNVINTHTDYLIPSDSIMSPFSILARKFVCTLYFPLVYRLFASLSMLSLGPRFIQVRRRVD